jgi:DNA-binding GntR family transcriptional regulator
VIERSSPVPLYFQVAQQLEIAIQDGRLAPGSRVDNEVALAGQLSLSRPTIRQAIQVLVDKGMVVRRRGVGTQVVSSRLRRSVELTSLYDDLLRDGQRPRTEVLRLELTKATADGGAHLGLDLDDQVWSLERLRYIDDQPLALMHNLVPASVVDLGGVDLEKAGLYSTLRQAGVHMQVANQEITARRASAREARLLHESKGAPLLTMQRTVYNDNGLPVEYGLHLYRPDMYAFQTTLVGR